MNKTVMKILRLILLIFVIVLVFALTLNLPITNLVHRETKNDYSNWMSETLSLEQKIIDVAMLGAHDAFTNDMSLFSRTDLLSADSIQTGLTGTLIKGFSLKQSKTQVSDVNTLLEAGVRYFDVRLSYHPTKEKWYTSHTYFSSDFTSVLSNTEEFLADNPGEFIIFDLQHIYGVDYDDADDMAEILGLFDTSGILEHAYWTEDKTLADLTYGDVTENKTVGGIIILSKFTSLSSYFWQYGSSVRSAWPNSDSETDIYDFLNAEAEAIESGDALTGNQMANNPYAVDSRQGFRVMQAVMKMQMSGKGIVDAIRTWSLLERAKDFNANLIDQSDFPDWLSMMPILMVDYSDSNADEFLDEIMEIIINFNQN
ncbi:MAG: hypothetical protein JXB20_01460 [Bacilli bacterium]|nr:hypothetical protein [Bacilli bacterium]